MDWLYKMMDIMRPRKRAYELTFNKRDPHVQAVLMDLAVFCRANESVWHEDQRKTDVLIGRNEVWQRIQNHLNLTPAQLARLYSGQQLIDEPLGEDEND